MRQDHQDGAPVQQERVLRQVAVGPRARDTQL